jgi:hypothetical protein
MIDLEENYKRVRDETFSEMLKSPRREKYKSFLSYMRLVKHIPGLKRQGNLLEGYYAYMRKHDDFADGDAKLPLGYGSAEEFIERSIEFARNPTKPVHELDYLFLYCYSQCEALGIDFKSETNDMLSSMLFDAKRYGKMQVFSKSELSYHFDLLDIMGCESACLKLYGEDPAKLNLLEPLGLASRIYYNLRDFDDETSKGLVNVSLEDMTRLGISFDDLKNPDSDKIKEWFYEQSMKGLFFLEGHKQAIGEGEFGLLARITFPLVYAWPAKKYFNGVLKSYQG